MTVEVCYTIWIMLTISLSDKVLRITFARKDEAAGNSEPPQGLPASKPVGGSGLSARESQMPHSVGTSRCLVRMSLLRGPKVQKELPALAAQLRAFSSLLSLPSQAQSVIKAFRRQGIGFGDVVNNGRFLLSRIESLSALLQVFQLFRGRPDWSASRPSGETV